MRLGKLKAKVSAALEELKNCKACPHECGVDRTQDVLGVCNVGRKVIVNTIAPHFGEESVLQGQRGSGTVFFNLCNLRCVFCQNWDVSQRSAGFHLTADELADWMMQLQEVGGCHNINLVTPEHVAPQVVEAIGAAVVKGLALPIVYNTSAYDSVSSLKMLEGLVDIYLPDFKFWSAAASHRYTKARDYPEVARAAIAEMHRQVGDLVFSPDGLAQSGLLVRHLAMPGQVEEGKAILSWLADHVSKDTYVHVMEQYRPDHLVGVGDRRAREGVTRYDEIDRPVSRGEAQALRKHARAVGLWRFEEPAAWEA